MGCTSLLVLLSSKPEYNMKIKLAIMLAPAGWNTKLPFIDNAVLKVTAKISDFLLQTVAF